MGQLETGLAPTTVEKTQKNPLLCRLIYLGKDSNYFRILKFFMKSLRFFTLHKIQKSLYKK
jgi:hypothetical protein